MLSFPLLQVSDGALRCFASLADRFTRRGVDPAPLAKHGLTEELLCRMAAAGGTVSGPPSSCKPGRVSTGAAPPAPDSKLSNQVSTIVSLLSTLCRGSPLVTHVCPLVPDRMHVGGGIGCFLIFASHVLRTCCALHYLTPWSRPWEETSAVCWTPCGWSTSCWCYCSKAGKRCLNPRRGQQDESQGCDALTARGRDHTDSSLTVFAAKTRML